MKRITVRNITLQFDVFNVPNVRDSLGYINTVLKEQFPATHPQIMNIEEIVSDENKHLITIEEL